MAVCLVFGPPPGRQTGPMGMAAKTLGIVGGVALVAALALALAGGEPSAISWVLIGPTPFFAVAIWVLRRRPDSATGLWLLVGGVTFLISVALGDLLLPLVGDEPWAWVPSIGRLLADQLGVVAGIALF